MGRKTLTHINAIFDDLTQLNVRRASTLHLSWSNFLWTTKNGLVRQMLRETCVWDDSLWWWYWIDVLVLLIQCSICSEWTNTNFCWLVEFCWHICDIAASYPWLSTLINICIQPLWSTFVSISAERIRYSKCVHASSKHSKQLAATLRGSRPWVQSASLIMTSLMTS